ncbi:hypothetical protein Tco_0680433 [Tanacetum coccineum]|uniref:Reverse transcriptase domain-containing protein n=1 Tax=Tanacetum coccineum TaxID=301880 RepID=A0ABQ4XKI4_9ASTR
MPMILRRFDHEAYHRPIGQCPLNESMLQREILHDVVGTSGYHYEVWQSFPVEKIEQGNEYAGRLVAESRGGGTGERVGRGRRGRGPRGGNDERVDELNGQGNDQGLGANGNVEGVNRNVEGVNRGVGGAPDFSTIIAQQLQNLLPAILAQNDFKFMMIEEFCPSHKMQKLETKLWNHVMVGDGHAAYTNRFHELASKDKNGRDDNKRTRTGNSFATTANPVGRENMGAWPKCTTYNFFHAPCHTPTMAET